VFNDLVFTPQVASQVEAGLRRNGRYIYIYIYIYIHTDIRTDAAESTAFLMASPFACVGATRVTTQRVYHGTYLWVRATVLRTWKFLGSNKNSASFILKVWRFYSCK